MRESGGCDDGSHLLEGRMRAAGDQCAVQVFHGICSPVETHQPRKAAAAVHAISMRMSAADTLGLYNEQWE